MGKIADRFAKKRTKQEPTLMSAYWGYHPNNQPRSAHDRVRWLQGEALEPTDGDRGCFEFSTHHMRNLNIDDATKTNIIQWIFDAVKVQLKEFNALSAADQQAFLDQEQARLEAVIDDLDTNGRNRLLSEFVPLAIVACCAISTLVAGGRLQQDDLNGDSYAWM